MKLLSDHNINLKSGLKTKKTKQLKSWNKKKKKN